MNNLIFDFNSCECNRSYELTKEIGYSGKHVKWVKLELFLSPNGDILDNKTKVHTL